MLLCNRHVSMRLYVLMGVMLALAFAGGAAADGAPVDVVACDDAGPLCVLPQGCEATDPDRLVADPVGVAMGCMTARQDFLH